MKIKKKRLDVSLVEREICQSRGKAQANIMAGKVLVNGQVEYKADRNILPEDVLALKEPACPFVSRGGFKLKEALEKFNISVSGKICADIGVATGGFSDCMLQAGAKKVYGVDVGKGQLASEMNRYDNFIFKPETNARYLTADMFEDKFDIVAIDVSFISLKLILEPVLNCMAKNSHLICLIKPQFELSKKEAPGGIVKDDAIRQSAVDGLKAFFAENLQNKFSAADTQVIECSTHGTKGNIEYLWHIVVKAT
jgi:23S rRNA (cytidine1920-2'-O)/16S rRNA (cytidine1409-2'-O)-methyltransferase